MQRLEKIVGQLAANPTAAPNRSQMQKLPTAEKFAPCVSEFYDFERNLTAEEKHVRKIVREWSEKFVAPAILPAWEKAEFPWAMIPSLRALKLGGGFIKGYGCAGLSLMSIAMLTMEMARVDLSAATFYLVHCGLAMESIFVCGSEEQKQKYLPGMADYSKIGCFCLTEPDYGSDASSLQTTARKVEGGWVLNGAKRWIGNGTMADVYVVWARNDKNEVQGFIVDKGAKGMSLEKIQNKIVMRSVQNAHIVFEDVFVPEANVMPNGTTFSTGVGKVLEVSRLFVAWLPVGLAMGAYDNCVRYLQARIQFGAPLTAYQIVQEKLVRMLGTIQAMFLTAERVTQMYQDGKATMPHITMAKAWNTLRGREVVALARELVGGNGTVTDFGVAKAFVDMEAVYTYEGSYEVNALVTGRAITGISAFKSAYKPKQKKAAAKQQ